MRENDDQNGSEPDPESQTTKTRRKARLLMRADATHRVILNSPIFRGMQFGAYGNTAPTGKTMTLQCQEDGKVVLLQIKVCQPKERLRCTDSAIDWKGRCVEKAL